MTPYGNTKLGQWLAAWQHQAITWTNVGPTSVKSSGGHLSAVPLEMFQISICWKITHLKSPPCISGNNDLTSRNKTMYLFDRIYNNFTGQSTVCWTDSFRTHRENFQASHHCLICVVKPPNQWLMCRKDTYLHFIISGDKIWCIETWTRWSTLSKHHF